MELKKEREKIIVSARRNDIIVSPHLYNKKDDIDKLITALKRLL
jgi:selenocysteine lyase/cysteine desulfurase